MNPWFTGGITFASSWDRTGALASRRITGGGTSEQRLHSNVQGLERSKSWGAK